MTALFSKIMDIGKVNWSPDYDNETLAPAGGLKIDNITALLAGVGFDANVLKT